MTTKDQSSTTPVQSPQDPLSDRVERWAKQIQSAQKSVTNKKALSILIGVIGPLLIACLIYLPLMPDEALLEGPSCLLAVLTPIVCVIAPLVLYNLWAKRSEKRAIQQLGDEIRQTCEAEGLSKAEVVEALAARVPSVSLRKAVLSTVDAETMAILKIRNRGLAFFRRNVAGKEEDALEFRSITLDYLSHKLYVEAVAALGMVSTIYAEIAPPFPPDVDVDQLIQFYPDPSTRVELATRKVLSGFDFEPDLKAILEAGIKRRDLSLLELLVAAQTQETDAVTALADASEAFKPLIRDEVFVGACIDYLGERATQAIQAPQALALIPHIRTVPYLLEVFDLVPFYPQGIDALTRLDESVRPQLLEALRTGNPKRRYNIALALGVMEAEDAKPVFTELLTTLTDPLERIGCCYGLVRLGETEQLDEIVQALDHSDADIRHAAAIALEHLPQPLEDEVYLHHLTDAERLVRLRLTRKLGSQGTDNPALIDALVARFEDGEEEVRSAAVDAMVKLGAEKVYGRMVELTRSSSSVVRACAYQVLGQLSDSQAVPLLVQTLEGYQPADVRRAVLSALGELQAVTAAEKLGGYLRNDELSGAAFWALLRVGFKDAEAAKAMLRRHGNRPERLFALSVLGDEKAKRQFKGILSPSTDIRILGQALEYARVLSNPELEILLRQRLTYSNQEYAPTDKLIPYLAFKALIHTLLAKP